MEMTISKTAAAAQARIDALETQLKEAKAKAQAITTRERVKAAKQARANETRRKVLIGAFVQTHGDPLILALHGATLDSYLTREDDRLLFGLPLLQNHTENNHEETSP